MRTDTPNPWATGSKGNHADDGWATTRDAFDFDAPFWVLGRLAEMTVLTRYMRRLLADRNAVIKRVAESDAWREYLAS